MKRLVLLAGLLTIFGSTAWAGANPNGGHIYLNCENFLVAGPSSFLGTAGKTTDAHGNCILTFPNSVTYATAKVFYPHSAVQDGTNEFKSYPTVQINSSTASNNVCFTAQMECSSHDTAPDLSANNAGDVFVVPSADQTLSVNIVANTKLNNGEDFNAAPSFSAFQDGGFICGNPPASHVCNDEQCVFRLTRVACANSDGATANVYGVDLQYSTP